MVGLLARRRAAIPVLVLAVLLTSCAQDWPTFGRDAGHSGLTGETAVGAAEAAELGVKWQTNTGQAVYASPVVAFNAAVNKRLVYVGNDSGVMSAFDAETGARVWWRRVGARIDSTASVVNGVVYFGSADKKLYALDAATGSIRCTFAAGGQISSSPVVADPDGKGRVVYFGDNGLTGADDGGRVWAVNAVDPNASTDCSQKWAFSSYGEPPGSQAKAGTWSPPAFAKDKNGRALVLFGGSSPDDAVYAVDAITGARVWRFQANPNHLFDADIGAAPTISPPGVNGLADGAVYVAGKENAAYSLNLRTGAQRWRFDLAGDSPGLEGFARSTAALVEDRLFFGYGAGLYQLNAVTGAKIWKTPDKGTVTAEVISSPAATGPDGKRILVVGDLAGTISAFDAGSGARLWSYRTGGSVLSSPAVSGGTVFEASSDGFLYAFAPGGAVSGSPETTVTRPADGSTVANPNGSFTISGGASDDTHVDSVLYAVGNLNDRTWWDAVSGTWKAVFTQNQATLSRPGATSTSWTGSFPVSVDGGSFKVQSESVDRDGQHDPTVAQSSVFIDSLGNPPDTTITGPDDGQIFRFPNNVRQSFPVTISGTAVDSGGSHPGIREVHVVVQNVEHKEYFCGPPGCNTSGSTRWVARYRAPVATLGSPGATSTSWSVSVPTYDHPHTYTVTAWAVDNDGQVEQSRPTTTWCVRDTGDDTCP